MIKAWQFIKDDGTAHGGYVPPSGRKEIYDGGIRLCRAGYHASTRVIDALRYAQGCIIRRVECGGEIIKGQDKLVCTERRELWRIDATNVLHEFSCRCAEDALALVDSPDQRSIAAIAAKRAWLQNEISSNDLEAAAARAAAARAVEEAAAWSAARSAASSAEVAAAAAARAAGATAWNAARAAAGAAAGAAARAAGARAWNAAMAAWAARTDAWNAAWNAAGEAAREAVGEAVQKQNRRLTAMLIAEAKKQGVLNEGMAIY